MKSFIIILVMLSVVYSSENQGGVSKVSVGVLALSADESQREDAERMTGELQTALSDMGFYDVYSPAQIRDGLERRHLNVPSLIRDPRCVLHVGRALGLDRMIYGSVEVYRNRAGISLYLIDVGLRQTIDRVHIKGEPGIDASTVLMSAVYRLHGQNDTLATVPYFGPQVDNKKGLLVSGTAFLGTGLLYAVINSLIEHNNGYTVSGENVNYRNEGLSGFSSSANQIPVFARPAALANSYTAVSDDAYGVLYNPAGMAWVDGPQMAGAYQYRYGLLDVMSASYVNRATREIGFGHALLYASDRDFALTELFFVTSVAYRLNHLFQSLNPLSLGVSLKVASSRVKNLSPDSPAGSSIGAGLDVGLIWELSERIRYGLLLRDLPVINRWKNSVTDHSYFEAHAATLHMGGSFQAGYSTLLVADGQIPVYQDQPWKMGGGLEHELFRTIALRIGMQKEIMSTDPTPWKITGGFGLRLDTENLFGRSLQLDCSYEHNTSGVFNVLNISAKADF
ncbi:hypothetical protein CHISP_2232 [Chitinispirillum alkaliphilum]|nr:hypothetical protein CHISP_2232 [Chitinispirillum alkaliphilum]